jgi:hypothetical protein
VGLEMQQLLRLFVPIYHSSKKAMSQNTVRVTCMQTYRQQDILLMMMVINHNKNNNNNNNNNNNKQGSTQTCMWDWD